MDLPWGAQIGLLLLSSASDCVAAAGSVGNVSSGSSCFF